MSEPALAGSRRSDAKAAMLFLAPNFIGFLIFVAMPVGFSLVMAFTNWDLIERAPFAFVGFENFGDMLWGPESKKFWKFFMTTVYLMLGLPISIAGSLFLAVLLSEPLRFGIRFVKTAMIGFVLAFTLLGVWLCIPSTLLFRMDPALAAELKRGPVTPGVAEAFQRHGLDLSRDAVVELQGAGGHFAVADVNGRYWVGPLSDGSDYGVRRAGYKTIGLILAIIGGSTLVALLFNRVGLRTLFYLPFFTTGVAQFILWKALFRQDSGPINAVLRTILASVGLEHVNPPDWLGSLANLLTLSPEDGFPESGYFGLGARDAIMIMGIWAAVGGNNMLLYLAGLSNVPGDLYEAAMIDGAGRWKTFWHVSWPQLAPTTFFILIMSVIGGLQGGFEQARVMTEGRPADTTVTLGFYIYREGFEEFRLGFASAVSWMLFLMIFVMTLINWKFGSRQLNA